MRRAIEVLARLDFPELLFDRSAEIQTKTGIPEGGLIRGA